MIDCTLSLITPRTLCNNNARKEPIMYPRAVLGSMPIEVVMGLCLLLIFMAASRFKQPSEVQLFSQY